MNDSFVVKVKPGSRKGPLVEVSPGGELTIYVRERAVDGKANDAVTRLLAAHLQLPNCQEAESNWYPERPRSSSVSASAVEQRVALWCGFSAGRQDRPVTAGADTVYSCVAWTT
jgi:uncharacterized protein